MATTELHPYDESHVDCMNCDDGPDHYADYVPDPLDTIPAGTPDSWIPDNPNEDGFCLSDFI